LSTRAARPSSPGPGLGGPAWPRQVRPRLPGWLAYRLRRVLAPNSAYRWLAGVLTRSPPAYRAFTATERGIPEVSGIHVMAPGYEQGIPGILERAGLARRDPAVPVPTLGRQRAH